MIRKVVTEPYQLIQMAGNDESEGQVHDLVPNDKRLTIREKADNVGIHGAGYAILMRDSSKGVSQIYSTTHTGNALFIMMKNPTKCAAKPKILIVLFYYKGAVHHEYATQGVAFKNISIYKCLRCLHDPQFESIKWQIHCNSPSLSAQVVQQSFPKYSISQVRQPPFSSDMTPCHLT
jgi:hypothetical protein